VTTFSAIMNKTSKQFHVLKDFGLVKVSSLSKERTHELADSLVQQRFRKLHSQQSL
jgi:hypothetical protein